MINCGASELLSSFARGQCPRVLRSSLAEPDNMQSSEQSKARKGKEDGLRIQSTDMDEDEAR